ncbi:tRNA-uridine aminocarboxypropyltransferase [Endozoicomonas sp. 8E]|uniref:tRNA-uridine aminocarboxypropyltransferase n=1 Tax=Endozoicomonas sp. 8E TaxID=3035692 RepID=UPI0029391F8C|nr:tRNA-uridine aminocarboxypropyltransferase [Endozoicomonas sp. 8E]WOG29268.1 DTW domain-containing protein [Endozoicomonas sp. 8E]
MARAKCPRCERPLRFCICQHLQPEQACCEVLILQHPDEVKHPLNTARIARLGIENCKVLVGEDFSENPHLKILLENKKSCLLFPGDEAFQPSEYQKIHGLPDVCILLDGTWRKARKILHLNPQLQSLPRISLPENLESRYRIRKSPHQSALSTIEATVCLMREFSGDPMVHQICLDSFRAMIDRQIEAMGRYVYEKNYRNRSK